MPEYLFQIKGKLGEPEAGLYGGNSNWSFPPIWTDKIEAKDSKEAKKMIEDIYGKKFPQRVLAKDLESNEFLLNLKEIQEHDHYTKKLFETIECLQCKSKFRVIEKYQLGHDGGGFDFCKRDCAKEYRDAQVLKEHIADVVVNHIQLYIKLPIKKTECVISAKLLRFLRYVGTHIFFREQIVSFTKLYQNIH